MESKCIETFGAHGELVNIVIVQHEGLIGWYHNDNDPLNDNVQREAE